MEHTPIFLFATAGVRLLEDEPRRELLSEVCQYAQQKTKFQLPDCDLHIQAISGQTEGLYGWLASNYLLGAFNNPGSHTHGKSHHTYGFLDLGGASAQIAFAPNVTEAKKHADDLQLLRLRTIDGVSQEFRVFVTTFLGYGVNEARRRYLEDLSEHHDSALVGQLPDPCLPRGMHKPVDGPKDAGEVLVGTGKFSECLARTLPLLDQDAPCEDSPCLFHGVHVPAIDFGVNHFVGVSEYWHTTHEIFEMGHTDKAYDFQTYQNRVLEFCSQDWDSIEKGISSQKWGKKVDKDRAAEVCFKASWLINMLHEGIRIPRVGLEQSPQHTPSSSHTRPQNGTKEMLQNAAQEGYLAPFQAVNKIDNTEVSWTLGKMVLYASSQIPPATPSTQSVGFGPNAPNTHAGIPTEFEHAGGTPASHPLSAADLADTSTSDALLDTDTDSDSDDSFPWSSSHPLLSHRNRTPGLFLIALILMIILLLLLGRERRNNLLRKISPFRRSSFSSFLSSRNKDSSSKGRYERLLEEGIGPGHSGSGSADLRNPGEFELGSIHGSSSGSGAGAGASSSDEDASSASSRASQISGRKRYAATPARCASPRGSTSAGVPSEGVGLGLGPVGWSGEEYRDAVGTGYRSRGASPSRLRSPLVGGFKESVD